MKRFGPIQIDVQRRFGLTRRGKCRSLMWLRHGSQLTFQEKCTSDVSDKRFQLAFVCFAAGEKRVHQLNFILGKYRASLEIKMDNFYRAYSDICMLDVPSAEHPTARDAGGVARGRWDGVSEHKSGEELSLIHIWRCRRRLRCRSRWSPYH